MNPFARFPLRLRPRSTINSHTHQTRTFFNFFKRSAPPNEPDKKLTSEGKDNQRTEVTTEMNTTEMKELLKEKERAEAKAETITQREEEAMKRLLDRDGGSLGFGYEDGKPEGGQRKAVKREMFRLM